MNTKNSQNIGIIQMIVCASLWSIAGIFIKLIPMNAIVIAGFRSMFAAITVIVFMIICKQKLVISKHTIISGIMLCLTFLCFVGATKNTTSANAIVLQYTAPIFILIFSFVFLHKKPKKLDLLAVALTIVGISVFFIDSIDGGQTLGNVLGLLSGVFMGAMFVAVGDTKGDEKMSGILFGHIFCMALGLPFMAFTENTYTFKGFLFVGILGVFQLGIPYILYALATKRCSAITCSIIAAIEPVLNPIWVLIFVGEGLGFFTIVGGTFLILVITGYSMINNKLSHKRQDNV